MRSLADIERAIDAIDPAGDATAAARDLLTLGEEVLGNWLHARDMVPTDETREGFRLLALHRQGTKGDPSFNACRETCRELAYYYNLLTMQRGLSATTDRVAMMKMICSHLHLFVGGKMQVAALGDFCCSSRPLRQADMDNPMTKEA
ncbi:MAG: hypothetical protein OEW59_00625 [Gammaproteobacteria bacterium]|nr:hypothetical protein [Gammaproteobacteria bacterium]